MAAHPAITSALAAAGATVGSAFSYQITGSNAPTGFAASGLPAGLSVNAASGAISGTPTAAGTANVTITASNGAGSGSATLVITIGAAAAHPAITSALAAAGTVGSAFSYQITGSNAPTGSLRLASSPAGLSVECRERRDQRDADGGGRRERLASHHLPAMAPAAWSATLVITVSAAGSAPVITSAQSASGTVGLAFAYQITGSGLPTSYDAVDCPPGLGVDSATGLISGTPATAGTFNVTILVTTGGGTGSANLVVTILSAASGAAGGGGGSSHIIRGGASLRLSGRLSLSAALAGRPRSWPRPSAACSGSWEQVTARCRRPTVKGGGSSPSCSS